MLIVTLIVILIASNALWIWGWLRRDKNHEDFVKWVFLDWAYRFKTGDFSVLTDGAKPEGPDLKVLQEQHIRFVRSKQGNENARRRAGMIKSKVV